MNKRRYNIIKESIIIALYLSFGCMVIFMRYKTDFFTIPENMKVFNFVPWLIGLLVIFGLIRATMSLVTAIKCDDADYPLEKTTRLLGVNIKIILLFFAAVFIVSIEYLVSKAIGE